MEKTAGLSIDELLPIHSALNKLLMVKGTGLSYKITKNILLIERAIKSNNKQADLIQKAFYIKDSEGKPIKYAALRNESGKLYLRLDADGNRIEAAPGEQNSLFVVDQSEEAIKAFEDLRETKYDLQFLTIDESIIEQLCKTNVIEGIDFSALLDVIIS